MPFEKLTRREALRSMSARLLALSSARFLAAASFSTMNAAPALLTRPIPSSQEMIPVIGLGTWQTFDVGNSAAERDALEDVLRLFVELGGKLIDSSPMYGRSEDVVGEIATKTRLAEKLFIATKVWTSGKSAG